MAIGAPYCRAGSNSPLAYFRSRPRKCFGQIMIIPSPVHIIRDNVLPASKLIASDLQRIKVVDVIATVNIASVATHVEYVACF